MEKLLTITVAAYNVESYLKQLLDSIVSIRKEILDLIEVLVINDGSKDKTQEIAKEYEQRFPSSVKLIDKENGGYGSTFNRGFNEAKGKYYRSLDGDDWVDSKSLEELVCRLSEIEADLILSDFSWVYPDGRVEIESFPLLTADTVYSCDEICKKVKWMRIHTIIYRTSLLKDKCITLDEHCFYTDVEYDIYPLPYVRSVYYFGKPVYCYRTGTNGQSVSTAGRKKNIAHGLTVAKSLLKFYAENKGVLSPEKKEYMVRGLADYFLWHIESLLLFDLSREGQREIRMFDRLIRDQSEEIYTRMENLERKAKTMRILRKTDYFAYWFVKIYHDLKK